MDFLPVISDMQTLELVYTLHPNLSQQSLIFSECADIGLGLIETNALRGVLSAQPSLARRESTTVTLRSMSHTTKPSAEVVVSLEPLQQMRLHFEAWRGVIDDIPLMLPANMPYSFIVQHLIMARLEYVLRLLEVHYLEVNVATMPEGFSEMLGLRAYEKCQGVCSKNLRVTDLMPKR
jgi:hypothetical protein